jgi:glycosyltransferase involved in cell wall biosynthesis
MNVPRSVGSASSPAGGRTETVRDKVGLADHDRLMVYVGNVNARRNVEGLLETLVVSPDWHLAIVGSAEWRLEKFGLWERVAAPVRRRIHVIDRQPDVSLPSFLSTADCGAFIPQGTHFNLYHCAPNKYFAMALAGIPLVVSDLPFLAGEVRRLGIGAVVRSTEPVVVRAALERAVAMKDQVRTARPRVAHEYAWERQAEQLILAYREAVGLR